MGDSMQLVNRIRNYLLEEEFEIKIIKDGVNVINYTSLGHFSDTSVTIYNGKEKLNIKGTNLVVTRLLKDEVLITGKIENIELG